LRIAEVGDWLALPVKAQGGLGPRIRRKGTDNE